MIDPNEGTDELIELLVEEGGELSLVCAARMTYLSELVDSLEDVIGRTNPLLIDAIANAKKVREDKFNSDGIWFSVGD